MLQTSFKSTSFLCFNMFSLKLTLNLNNYYIKCILLIIIIIDVTSVNEQETSITISQKNSIKTKNIHEKLNKLQVLYELNKRRNNKLMLWRKMRRLTEMIEKLTRQHVAASTVNQCMKNQLKRLKKIHQQNVWQLTFCSMTESEKVGLIQLIIS